MNLTVIVRSIFAYSLHTHQWLKVTENEGLVLSDFRLFASASIILSTITLFIILRSFRSTLLIITDIGLRADSKIWQATLDAPVNAASQSRHQMLLVHCYCSLCDKDQANDHQMHTSVSETFSETIFLPMYYETICPCRYYLPNNSWI